MDLEGIMLGKISQTKMLYVITYMWNRKKKKKIKQMNEYKETETGS